MNKEITGFDNRIELLRQPSIAATLKQIRHGVEREALRINPDGQIAQTPHPNSLGSALSHDYITTDFSESLLELITPPDSNIGNSIKLLQDIHKQVASQLDKERLWPLSMPCFVADDKQIPIAQYGQSNIGKMKTLYRVGLQNRYGAMMQIIAGVHFNFSLPDSFWRQWLPALGLSYDQDSISAAYFALIRNFRRFCWLIPYLCGASPALCSSFLQGKTPNMPFKKLGQGTLYLPYATSLRMSDLGYTNSAQSELAICYNRLDTYVNSVRNAINTPSKDYLQFNSLTRGQMQQLNANILQIENELYSPIRPKQPTQYLEKPTDALEKRGVSYIEVRALDVNPFSPLGISEEQFRFLDCFLLLCLIHPCSAMSTEGYKQTEANLVKVVEQGRNPDLVLNKDDQPINMRVWAKELMDMMRPIAQVLDGLYANLAYSDALAMEHKKVVDDQLTFSGRIMSILQSEQLDVSHFGLRLSEQYQQSFRETEYQQFGQDFFQQQAKLSLQAQAKREQADSQTFDDFLAEYFALNPI